MTKKNVVYLDGSEGDSRILDGKDLAKAGVEGFTETRFFHNVPMEVDSEVAKALVAEAMFGKFEIITKVEAKEIEKEKEEDKDKESKDEPEAVQSSTKSEPSTPKKPVNPRIDK